MKVVARHRVLLAMTVLVGAASFFVGNAYQAQMPGFARDLNVGRADLSYSALLAADACGGLIGGILLESRGLLQPRTRTAFVLAMIWCLALAGFARANSYALALCLLCIAGFVELAFNSMAQALVQLNAPNDMRGGVIGVFSMSAMGLRTFSGLSVGLLGSSIGIHYSLSYSACALLAVIGTMSARLAHEIRNPLSSITLNIDLIRDEIATLSKDDASAGTEARSLVQSLDSEMRRIQRVTEDYLKFARMPKPVPELISLNEVLDQQLSFMESLFTATSVQLVRDFDPALPQAVTLRPDWVSLAATT